jgi:RHS repeat-associated protein
VEPLRHFAQMTYDSAGNRVKKVTDNGTTIYLGESYEVRSGGEITKYVFLNSLRVAEHRNEPTGSQFFYFYHTDHLTSTNLMTDINGQKVCYFEYEPYGKTSRADIAPQLGEANATRYKFTNQEEDPEIELYYYNARYYDPELGRFIQADPYIQNLYDPQSLNRYSYVRNNPINLIDPSGNFIWAIIGAILKAVITAAVAGAITNIAIQALSGNIHSIKDVARAGATGAAFGATLAAGSIAAGALQLTTGVLGLVAEATTFGAASYTSNGVNNLFDGNSFNENGVQSFVQGLETYAFLKSTQVVIDSGVFNPVIDMAKSAANKLPIIRDANRALDKFRNWVSKSINSPPKNGRLGSASTRDQIDDIAGEMERRGWEVTNGGGRFPEEYIRGAGGGTKGSSYPDITAQKNGRTLRINTIDTLTDGVTPSPRETMNAQRIRNQKPTDHLLLIPKSKK